MHDADSPSWRAWNVVADVVGDRRRHRGARRRLRQLELDVVVTGEVPAVMEPDGSYRLRYRLIAV